MFKCSIPELHVCKCLSLDTPVKQKRLFLIKFIFYSCSVVTSAIIVKIAEVDTIESC